MCRTLTAGLLIVALLALDFSDALADWDRTFGGTEEDYGWSVQQTTDGGYIIAGVTGLGMVSGCDVWLIKTDVNGIEEWNKIFDRVEDAAAHSVQQTGDGGYIMTGTTVSSETGWPDAFLIKTDNLGNEEWNKTFGGAHWDRGNSVQQTTDGGYIIAGWTYSFGEGSLDVWLIKTDSLGNEQWNKTFGGAGQDMGNSVQQTDDGGYVIAGTTRPYGTGRGDVWLIKTDSLGNEQWNRTFGGAADYDEGYDVQQTTDGGYIIGGQAKFFGEGNVYLIKTDSLGNEEWSRTFGDIEHREEGYSVRQTTDGGYVIAGTTCPYTESNYDVLLIKSDSLGNEEWNRTFGSGGEDTARSVQQTTDGGYIIAGGTWPYGAGGPDVWLIKADVPELTSINLASPPDDAVLTSTPTFSWTPNGGTDNVFALDLSLTPDFAAYYSTYENLHIAFHETSLTMPDSVWNMIPPGREIYWRVRGADREAEPLTIITSDEVWSFTKD